MSAENRVGIAGRVALATAVAFGAGAVTHEMSSGDNAAEATSACVGKTRPFEIAPGQTKTFRAKDAIITGDVWVKKGNGTLNRNFDDLAETGAVTLVDSKDCVSVTVKADYGASVLRIADIESEARVAKREKNAIKKMASTGGHRAADVYFVK